MKKIFFFLSLCLFLSACNSQKDILYLQDLHLNQKESIPNIAEIKVEPGDELSIVVSCKDPELSAILNMPIVSYQSGASTNLYASNTIMGYTVDNQGNINYPIIGQLHVAGLTREEVRQLVESKIKEAQLLNDFVVTVNYNDMKIYVMGEVNSPGTYQITDNHLTVLQALSMAHDLTIYGRRDQIYVMREDGNSRISYKMDIRSDSVFKSPAFYLKQNDIIYVAPNKVRAGQSTVNGNSVKSASLWLSVASVLATLYVVFYK